MSSIGINAIISSYKKLGSVATRRSFTQDLMQWGPVYGRRGLPWQVKQPYAVWVSEIMLQQTQVETVKPYFIKFMSMWPDVKKLASAQEDDVMAAWAGLGYYRRAKFLHEAAQVVVSQWGGSLPQSAKDLMTLPGIGRSTAAAIASISYGEKVAIMDGNVTRVLSRYFGYSDSVLSLSTKKIMWTTAEALVDTTNPGLYTQFIMDLGATICTPKKPLCNQCPVQKKCIAYKKNIQAVLPHKIKSKKQRRVDSEVWQIFFDGTHIIMKKNIEKKGVWQSMHLFANDCDQFKKLERVSVEKWSFLHVFSHYDLNVEVVLDRISVQALSEVCDRNKGWLRVAAQEALNLSIPKPVKDVILRILQGEKNETVS